MRGRAADITDPGTLGWQVVWEALKTEPPAEGDSTLTQELGLDREQEIDQPWGSRQSSRATEFSGTRHGRPVALRIGVVPGVRQKAMNEVQVTGPVVPFHVREDGGRLVSGPEPAPEVDEVLAEIGPAPEVWRKLEVEGGPDGIRARRPVTAHNQGYVYDLWLAERLADRLGA